MGQRTHLDVTPRWAAGTPLHSLMAETRSDCLEQFSTYPLLIAMPGMLMEREASQYNITIISILGDVKKYHGDGVTGKWFRFLVAAASREDAKTFFRGVEKYAKLKDANIVSVKAINLAWWTYDISGGDGWNIMRLVQNIDQMNASAYGDIDELHKSRGKILISILNDADGGSRSWPILPTQDVSLSDYQHG
ncbi:hypothetical protein BDV34DRAFT_213054 [Aspergillus parasiticus]|uniref:Uncharacterized protein n=1 Tax=Aspergillus parasiticus TaxID=5067 RepID=A0A5N6DK41_ASPPA|nr:hypothetical protein BDV34DRAFT_213054 [Aspergillus parasiticus]